MAGWLQDVRCAVRQLARNPEFTTAAVVMLGLGICANSTAFSWIEGTMLHPVPGARDTSRLVTVMRGGWNNSPSPPLSYPDYRDLRATNRTMSGLLAYNHDWITLTGGATPQRIYVARVSGNYFDVLGIRPWVGRFFRTDEEARPGGMPGVVLGYSLWRTRFGGDDAIVGRSIEIAQHPVTVIGVAPEGFRGCMPGIREDAWVPLDPLGNDGVIQRREYAWLNVMGRLRPGVDRASGTQDLEVLMQRLVAEYPEAHAGVNTITLDPLWRSPFGANVYMAATLPFLLPIAGVVLLLTCANVATLALVRFVARRRDTAIRDALGAGRARMMRQMVLEGLLVSLGGGVAAIVLTLWTSGILGKIVPPNASPIAVGGAVDRNVMAAVLLLAAVSSALCGLLPAWQSSQVTLAEVLKEEAGSVSTATSNRRLLSGLVVVQVALSLALLVCAGLFGRTLEKSRHADPGFDQAQVVTASVDLRSSGYADSDIVGIEQKLLTAAENLPGVQSASLTDWLPFNYVHKTIDAYPEGYTPQLHESQEVRRAEVSEGYFATMRIPIVEGRAFTRADNENALPVAVVDETAAAHYWPQKDAIGQRLRIWGHWFTVVGVAKNSKHQRVSEALEPMVYLSYFQSHEPETILQVRSLHEPRVTMAELVDAVHQVNPRLAVFDVRSLRETTQLSTLFEKTQTLFASTFALLALVLAGAGIYGVVSYRTQLRIHEIGIRMALGASRGNVLRLIVLQGLRLVTAGLALGIVLALALTRYLSSQLYGVSATDPVTIMGVTVLLGALAALACWLPATRALRMDPVAAMHVL